MENNSETPCAFSSNHFSPSQHTQSTYYKSPVRNNPTTPNGPPFIRATPYPRALPSPLRFTRKLCVQQLTARTAATLFLVVLALFARPAAAQMELTCQGNCPCSCTMSDGSGVVDISSLGYSDGTARFEDEKDYNGFSYSYNPCFSYTIKDCEGAAVCKAPPIGGTTYEEFGTQASASWSYNGFYPIASYTGKNGKASIEFICDRTFVEPQLFNYGEINIGEVTMQIFSKCACPGECPSVLPGGGEGGLTAGSVMLIIALVCVVMYLAGGITYNRVRRQVSGAELVPQREFWAGLPGLVKEGCVFTWGCVRHRGNRTDYEAV